LYWMYIIYRPNPDPGASDEAHGNIVPFIVLALFWWKRKQLLALQLRLWWPGLLIVGLGLILHVVGYMVQQPRISIVALFTGIYGLTGLAWGPQWLRESFFPFFLFAFCVPLGWSAVSITFPLRLLVCQLVEWISGTLLQIDIMREGTVLMDPMRRYHYEIAPACSGIRSLFAISAVTIIYAFMSFRSWWKRGVLIASAIPLAVFGNVLRLLAIIVAAEIWGQEGGAYVDKGGPFGIISLLPYVAPFAAMVLLGHLLHEERLKPAPPPEPTAT